MDRDKAFMVQKQARDSVKTLQSYLTDLQSWEAEMKRKESALKGDFEQDLPPVRSKVKKDRRVIPGKKKTEKRISSSDYSLWEKFDVDKACEEVDMEALGPTSLDSKNSEQIKQEKLREEAQYEKERGNGFVKQEKWDEAINCYNRAIELVKDDAIYYANRGLCHLKKDSLHQAESDCTEALRLDPTYVKAYQRRAAAREKLGSLRSASHDLNEVLKLEPRNAAARKQMLEIKTRMGTKGSKSKSSPLSTPTAESRPITTSVQPKIIELEDPPTTAVPAKEKKTEVIPQLSPLQKWRDGIGEPITVIKPVKKPPHLRSKRALKPVLIQEIPLGKTSPEKPPTRMKIIEIEDTLAQGDTNNNKSEDIINNLDNRTHKSGDVVKKADNIHSKFEDITKKEDNITSKCNGVASPESEKLGIETVVKEKDKIVNNVKDKKMNNLVAPVNSVQFMSDWKQLKGNLEARSDYLNLIDPMKLPTIFANALESDVLSDLLQTLRDAKHKFTDKTITAYLRGLVRVRRLSALAMFLSQGDKEMIHKLLVHCRTVEGCSDEEIADLKNKFEL